MRRLLALVLHRRRAALHGRDRRVAVRRARARHRRCAPCRDRTGRRTLIVGAGRTGRSLMRELRETAGERVVGLRRRQPAPAPPPRPRRAGARGARTSSRACSSALEPDIVLVTIPDAPRDRLDAVVAACADGRRRLPLRPARDRPRSARRARRRRRVTRDDVRPTAARERSLLDRCLAAFPFAVALARAARAALLARRRSRKTPTVFTDELEWTQISRAIAATGPRGAARASRSPSSRSTRS